ncbi:hypothetical protein MPC38_06710 [Prescottella equi]|uniref:hypothetical protein n=1 Tax=Rhodococcus hoagii TaxID=43767 RepID=UPI001F5B11C6|nr:hypothetical protein [Prescottella equi]UNQ40936.1 hypothetical protein MPC38_06710 [Prescottella equi]
MERQQPNEHQRDRLSDVDLVILEVAQANEQKRPISDAGARVIASMLHNGQGSAMYALSSSGAILEGLDGEISRDEVMANTADLLEIQRWAGELRTYVEQREDHGPVEGWHKLWLDRPVAGYDEEDRCTECGAHIAEPHSPHCPLADKDIEDEPGLEPDLYMEIQGEDGESHEIAVEIDRGPCSGALTRKLNAYSSEPNQPEDEPTLEDTIKRKFFGVTTARLIQRMEKASDFATDDEEIELNRRLKEQGKTWRWTRDIYNPRIEVIELGEES